MTHRNQHLVRYIWLCLEISQYPPCASWGVADEDNRLVAEAIESLFSSLSTWQPLGDLTLDLSVYSPSDARDPFSRYLTFEPDLNPKDCPYAQDIHEDSPGIPPQSRIDKLALIRLFDDVLLGDGNSRELDNIVYWFTGRAATDPDFPGRPHILSDYEAFNRMLTELEQSTPDYHGLVKCWEQMPSVPAVTRMLLLTSQLLRPDADRHQLEEMLREAAVVALRMPQLQTLEIWEGRKGLAALFKYQSRLPRLTWKATWDFSIPDSVTRAWDEVSMMSCGRDCAVVKQVLDGRAIKSHADSIVQLQLSQTIVRPVSLQQIRREQRYLDP
ncbi:unnamed protein product [Clonostachys solani]|uniref:DUF6546 domain-containing protein n=1 Tax=Clonostachys solani TaxID=160281 RepID=A0A9N9W5D6_9HYPO|nr:unnamed protein product [Clonostachys solani]